MELILESTKRLFSFSILRDWAVLQAILGIERKFFSQGESHHIGGVHSFKLFLICFLFEGTPLWVLMMDA
jgi:hypothetical protein